MRPPWRSKKRAAETVAGADRPIFFIHVMKTGGTTVFRNLRENYPLQELYPYKDLDIQFDGLRLDIRHHLSVSYLLSLSPERRSQIKVYTGHFPFVATELMGADHTTMTILRDPIDRTVSLLRQFRRKAPWMDDSYREPPMATRTLEEVYEHPLIFGPLIRNHQTKIFSMRESDNPESYMDLLDVDEARLELAKHNLDKVDIVGLTERYDDLLDELEERFGWVVDREARANPTPRSEVQEVDPSLLERIAEDNAIDIEFYRYAQEVQARRTRR